MIQYYDNLAKIFSRGENALFHAAAKQKYFGLISLSPIASDKEKANAASLQLLSTLAVPKESSSDIQDDMFTKRKVNRLTSLLNFNRAPTRDSLLEQIETLNTLKTADPVLVEFYNLLENKFHPLDFNTKSKAALSKISSTPEYKPYTNDLLNVILDKLFLQVSEVYETIKLDFLVKLATFED
ncbi:unnamed protein product [Ambrosiozyma monospora]|uniref:Unnamed protein product n=1 Tax=Ambrosiozyma monospora TaxID=43982 RepID=A0A9W6WJJ5_AMBMO|nr:unnamed protein product [Ambrosiozyma monospora]